MIKPSDFEAVLLAAGIPILGVASTGRIDFAPEATPEQRQEAQTLLENYNQATVDANKAADRQAVHLDLQDLFDNALAAIIQIEENLAQIAGETSPATLIQLAAIVNRMAQRETQALNREKKIIKALMRLTKQQLNP